MASCGLLTCAVLLAGCATTSSNTNAAGITQVAVNGQKNIDPELVRRLQAADQQAQQAIASGQDIQKIIAPYKRLSRSYADSPEPWAHMAQRYFDARHYGDAITAAAEAQKRDASHQVALSVMAVSGLRAATDALSALDKGSLGNAMSRADADRVVRLLRGATGERVLVPKPQDTSQGGNARKSTRRSASSGRSSAGVVAPEATPAAGNNPFLKLN